MPSERGTCVLERVSKLAAFAHGLGYSEPSPEVKAISQMKLSLKIARKRKEIVSETSTHWRSPSADPPSASLCRVPAPPGTCVQACPSTSRYGHTRCPASGEAGGQQVCASLYVCSKACVQVGSLCAGSCVKLSMCTSSVVCDKRLCACAFVAMSSCVELSMCTSMQELHCAAHNTHRCVSHATSVTEVGLPPLICSGFSPNHEFVEFKIAWGADWKTSIPAVACTQGLMWGLGHGLEVSGCLTTP